MRNSRLRNIIEKLKKRCRIKSILLNSKKQDRWTYTEKFSYNKRASNWAIKSQRKLLRAKLSAWKERITLLFSKISGLSKSDHEKCSLKLFINY
jgi:predicted RNA-binding protein